MNLDFLSPRSTDGAPACESPIVGRGAGSGATIGLRQGWPVPVAFGDRGRGGAPIARRSALRTRPQIAKLELQGHASCCQCPGDSTLGTAVPHRGSMVAAR